MCGTLFFDLKIRHTGCKLEAVEKQTWGDVCRIVGKKTNKPNLNVCEWFAFYILFPECLVYSVACYDTLELNLNKEKRHNYT